jgi:2-iminobutanoate/2-iminopropanoate deaminase
MRKQVVQARYPQPAGQPSSRAVKAGSLVFTGGIAGLDPKTGKLAPGGIEAEARMALGKLKATLEDAGTSLENVVKVTVFIRDFNDYPALNRVYIEFFPSEPPARMVIQVPLQDSMSLEFDAVAVIPD